jgi:hypothetical protein
MSRRTDESLAAVMAALQRLEHEADLMKTVVMLKDPGSAQAAEAFEGLRKQVVAGASERRAHLTQVVSMAVAVSRATSVEDLRPQVREWMTQSEIVEAYDCEPAQRHLLFESIDGSSLLQAAAIEVLEPAYIDARTNAVLRTGRAREVAVVGVVPSLSPSTEPAPADPAIDGPLADDAVAQPRQEEQA